MVEIEPLMVQESSLVPIGWECNPGGRRGRRLRVDAGDAAKVIAFVDLTSRRDGVVLFAASALGAALMVLGCTDFEPASDTWSSVNAQLQGEQQAVSELGAGWSCLSDPVDRVQATGLDGVQVVYSLRLVDFASREPFTLASVQVCGLTDIACTDPLMAQVRPDAEGWLHLPLRASFVGYLEITGNGIVPYIFSLPDGIHTMNDYPLVMLRLEHLLALNTALNIMSEPTLGDVAVRAFDCQGTPAVDVVLRSSSGGTPFYFENGLPNTTRRQTDPDGLAGFIGARPGVTLLETDRVDGTATASKSVIVRPGWMTVAYLRPSQASGS